MKQILIASFSLVGLLLAPACGSDDPVAICEDGVTATCQKFDECGLQTEAECRADLGGQCDSNAGCEADETFDADAANDCIDQIGNATCETLLDGTADLSACDVVCT